MNQPLVVAVEMGYGHLRAAYPLAEALGTRVLQADRPPLADEAEQRVWQRARQAYEAVSRLSQVPGVGTPLRWLLDETTAIPHLFPHRDMSAPTPAVVAHDRLIARGGLGRGLADELRRSGAPLLTTFYTMAIAAERHGVDRIYCVVTDTDVNRIWAPVESARTRIHYLVPTRRVERRMRVYGVPADHIRFTGFPLPPSLLGGRELAVLRRNLAGRLVRLDPEQTFAQHSGADVTHFLGALPERERGRPPLVTFAVGGAGAQAGLASEFLPSLAPLLAQGRIRLALVAGVRREVEARFLRLVAQAGLGELLGTAVRVLCEDGFDAYYLEFNHLLAETDVLWTKPSEMVFYGALGLPLVLSRPVGAHERYNLRWAAERGVGLRQRDARTAGDHIAEWLHDGTLAAAAWSGFMRLPKFGLFEVLEAVERGEAPAPPAAG